MIETTDEISENKIIFNALKEGYKIPNIIHYTFCTETNIPNEMKLVIEHNKKMCDNCTFIFYNDNDCDEFIKANFDEEVYNAYNSINPVYGAMKADFFRYCVLYKTGGIYIDIKSIIKCPIFKLINKTDICILDYPRTAYERWRKYTLPTFEQWLLIFAPGHPYLLSMINLMVHYIKMHYEPVIKYIPYLTTKEKILNVTGPDAFAKAIFLYVNSHQNAGKTLHRNIDYKKYFKINYNENYKQMYKMNDKTHYSDLNAPLYKNQVKYEIKSTAFTYSNIKTPRKNLNLMK